MSISLLFKSLLIISLVILLPFVILLRIRLVKQTDPYIVDSKENDAHRTAIVFGAGINARQSPTRVLKDRLDKTIQIYQQDQIDTILVSGGPARSTNESLIMKAYLEDHGIPSQAILDDGEGVNTFQTLVRAKEEFNIHDALLITQNFHLPRAIAIGKHLDMDVIGIAADTVNYRINSLIYWNFRELFAYILTLYRLSQYSGT